MLVSPCTVGSSRIIAPQTLSVLDSVELFFIFSSVHVRLGPFKTIGMGECDHWKPCGTKMNYLNRFILVCQLLLNYLLGWWNIFHYLILILHGFFIIIKLFFILLSNFYFILIFVSRWFLSVSPLLNLLLFYFLPWFLQFFMNIFNVSFFIFVR